jgi:hypothetical protein
MAQNLRSLLVFNADKSFNAAETGKRVYALVNTQTEINPQYLQALNTVLDFAPGVRQAKAAVVQAMILRINEMNGGSITQGSISKLQKEISEFLADNTGTRESGKLLSTRKGQKGGLCRWSDATDIPSVSTGAPTVVETPVAPVPVTVSQEVAAIIASVMAQQDDTALPTEAPVDSDQELEAPIGFVKASDDVPDFVVDEDQTDDVQETEEVREEEELSEMADETVE